MTGKEYITNEFVKMVNDKENAIETNNCPSNFDLLDASFCEGKFEPDICKKCWKQALESEVKK